MAKAIVVIGGSGGGSGSDDCTATASDVLKGKTYIGSDTDDEAGTGALELSGSATNSQVLSGATYYNTDPKTRNTGTMTNRGAVTSTLNAGGSYTIPEGYHNGSGRVTANSLASQTSGTATAANILSGKTAYVNGSLVTGTMTDVGSIDPAKSATLSSGTMYVRMTNGAHVTNASSGYPEVSISQSTVASTISLTASKLAYGQTVCGITGTAQGFTCPDGYIYYRGDNDASFSLQAAFGASATSGTCYNEPGGAYLSVGSGTSVRYWASGSTVSLSSVSTVRLYLRYVNGSASSSATARMFYGSSLSSSEEGYVSTSFTPSFSEFTVDIDASSISGSKYIGFYFLTLGSNVVLSVHAVQLI